MGLEVTVKNKSAIITAVTAGRVRIDFNNRLAGRTLKYKYKVTEKPTKPVDIVKLLLKMSYGTSDGFDIEHHGKAYKIKLPDACKYDQRWLLTKFRLVTDLREIAGAETVSFIEEYEKPEKKVEADKKEEKVIEEKKEAPREKAPEELTEEDRTKA
ncbi:MAG: hypothetical protein KJ672_03965 [Candidatus Thermoplasmatota archaeon]|nr:hypothetical protein [Candidatus Thermoplasmatota archaeon]